MKKILVLFLTAVMVMSLAACGKGKTEAADSEAEVVTPTEELSSEVVTIEDGEAEDEAVDYMALYDIILTRYYDAIEAKLDAQGLTEAGVSYLCSYLYGDDALGNIGYTFKDITGDDIPELFIGGMEDNSIIELYTIYDKAVVSVLTGGERNAYYLCEDGMIANEGSSSAAVSGYNYFKINGSQLEFVEGVLFDGDANPENPWFKADCNDFFSFNDEPMTESDANAIIEKYEKQYVKFEHTPFASYEK